MSKPNKNKVKDEPLEGFSWEELASKIDWEGGLAEYFVGYSSGSFKDQRLDELAAAFRKAYGALESYLSSKGGML